MRKVSIEWKHFDKEGKTCTRCSATEANLSDAIKELRSELDPKEIQIEFKETKLPESCMDESNEILIDGILFEKLLLDAKAGMNDCLSCGDLIGKSKSCCCRTIIKEKEIFEEIPARFIKQAILNRLNSK